MTEHQIGLIKKSWRLLRMIDPKLVGGVFYDRLFSVNPGLKKMFAGSAEEQSVKLIEMLDAIILRLGRFEELDDDIQNLAKRHLSYGVRSEHYEAVGSALLWTFRQALGVEWNEELENAWGHCYGEIAERMKKTKW